MSILKYFAQEARDARMCKSDNRGRHFFFSEEGKFFNDVNDTECLLFPSKENRDWSTFKAPKKHKEFKPFQKVITVLDYIDLDYGYEVWAADFYSHYDNGLHFLVSGRSSLDNEILPYEGNEDKLGRTVG